MLGIPCQIVLQSLVGDEGIEDKDDGQLAPLGHRWAAKEVSEGQDVEESRVTSS